MEQLTLTMARAQAKRFSNKYNCSWFVRKISNNNFQPWAHDSETESTVAQFYCGKEVTK